MKKILLILMLVFMSACSQPNTTQTDSPLMWINYDGDKYTFNDGYTKDEMNMENITSTNTFTGIGDGVMFDKEIFIDQKTGDLFVIDDTGSNRVWVQFTILEK